MACCRRGRGSLQTRQQFTDFQLHVEFATPSEVKGDSQGRGNSGVFLLGKFEVQVLDSYQNITYPDGQAAAMYGQYPPLVNVVARARRVADLRHRLHGAPFRRRRHAGETGHRHRPPQRRGGAQRRGVLGTDPAQERAAVHARHGERPDRAAGSRQSGPLPQHLDSAAEGI